MMLPHGDANTLLTVFDVPHRCMTERMGTSLGPDGPLEFELRLVA